MPAILNAHSDNDTASRPRLAAVVILVALATAMPFATRDAVAQTQQQVAKGTAYQAYLAADCPDGSNFCSFTSEDVPDTKLLEIHRVACQGWHVSTLLPSFVVIAELETAAGQFLGRIDFLKTTYAPASGGSVWAISEEVLMFIPAGHRLQVSLNSGSTGVGSYGCTISGFLTKGK